jgi:hypothetical protein
VTSINEQSIEQNPVFVYPNPASEKMVVSFDAKSSENPRIQISELISGRIIHAFEQTGHIGNHRIEFNVANFPSGLYSIAIHYGKNVHIIPMTIQH